MARGASFVVFALAIALSSATADAQRVHTVRAGDSVAQIARRYGVSVSDLLAANRMRNASIRPGQEIVVPARGITYVRPGQTLSHIARANRCSIDELARINRIRPGSSLRVGQQIRLPGFRALAEVTQEDWGESEYPGVVRVQTRQDGDRVIAIRDERGHVFVRGLEDLGRAMTRADDAEGSDVPRPHPRLSLVLAAISDHFGGRPVRIISGFREVGGYTRESSRHVSGQAVDIHIVGVPNRAIWDFCRTLSGTGCGLYPRSSFVHVDVRDGENQWVDWSGPGQRPRYGNLRGPYPRRRTARRNFERVGRHVTRGDLVPRAADVVGPTWESGFGLAAPPPADPSTASGG